jgi:hypothetical protein
MCIRMKTLNGFYRVNIERLITVKIVNGFMRVIVDVYRIRTTLMDWILISQNLTIVNIQGRFLIS